MRGPHIVIPCIIIIMWKFLQLCLLIYSFYKLLLWAENYSLCQLLGENVLCTPNFTICNDVSIMSSYLISSLRSYIHKIEHCLLVNWQKKIVHFIKDLYINEWYTYFIISGVNKIFSDTNVQYLLLGCFRISAYMEFRMFFKFRIFHIFIQNCHEFCGIPYYGICRIPQNSATFVVTKFHIILFFYFHPL
jgi:hypothetical protein